jgi:site-specific DNA-methyltransferase (adenine-specific)
VTPYYQDDACTIYHGDCLEVMPLLGTESVGVVMTDPPFSVPIKYEDNSNRYARSWGDLAVMEPFFRETFQEMKRLCRPGAHTYICCDDESYPVFFKASYPLWPQSHLLVWYKPSGRRGRGWMHSYELILHLRYPETRYSEGFRQDVVGIMPVRTLNREHPAEKPGSLWSFLAEGVPGDQTGVVLDPFLGGGASLRWCKDRGKKAIGIEIEERYCEVAAKRLAQEVLAL